MTVPFDSLTAKLPGKVRQRANRRTKAMLAAMKLREIRVDRRVSQVVIASRMDTNQSGISKLEQRLDVYVSTLQEYVHALGGTLNIVASFPDGDIRINQFDPPKRKR
jgi:transcriptional regulator with XRE-family HTH domain